MDRVLVISRMVSEFVWRTEYGTSSRLDLEEKMEADSLLSLLVPATVGQFVYV